MVAVVSLAYDRAVMAIRWSIVDLAVILAIGLLVLAIVPGSRRIAQDARGRAECANNLRQIGQALFYYQQDQSGFPRGTFEPDAPLVAFSGSPPGAIPAANDTSVPFWLLVKNSGLDARSLVCLQAAADGLAERRVLPPEATAWSNFPNRLWMTYSIANPYVMDVPVMGNQRRRDTVIAADINPGGQDVQNVTLTSDLALLSKVNSPNHRREGQNVLFADGTVSFEGRPFVGPDNDNIYAYASLPPVSTTDTLMVPRWTDGPQVAPAYTRTRKAAFYSFALAGLVGFAVLIGLNLRRQRLQKSQA